MALSTDFDMVVNNLCMAYVYYTRQDRLMTSMKVFFAGTLGLRPTGSSDAGEIESPGDQEKV